MQKNSLIRFLLLASIALLTVVPLVAETPDLVAVTNEVTSELASIVARYSSDSRALSRRYDASPSPAADVRWRSFYDGWKTAMAEIDFDDLSVEGRIDYILLNKEIEYGLQSLEIEGKQVAEAAPLIPFASQIVALQESRRNFEKVDPGGAAKALDGITNVIKDTHASVERGLEKDDGGKEARLTATKSVAKRAAGAVDDLSRTLEDWHGHYDGFDPLFSWWTREPYEKAHTAIEAYSKLLREKLVGEEAGEDAPIVGDPAGRDSLMADLEVAMIPYTPEQLIAIGEREFEWCDREMKKAAAELGYDDWHDALEYVKGLHVEPGRQVELTRDLANEAIAFLRDRDLLTIPPLAVEIWRMTMLSPERQKVAPFFLGGEEVQVAFPTDTMSHDEKLMAMRGNNIHFSRAVVHHELIPGHHLQGFMIERYQSHRRLFYTPFWMEGWALYWEMRLWDLGFPQSPEDRIGMLFWRMHRCARIVFSLKFHLGEMAPQEAIDYLVERVGHERDNATAEVRRSFEGGYPPLYQLAYMMGALQLRALHEEMVVHGEMTEKEFHDAILQGGIMPIEMVRARLRGDLLERDYKTSWRYAGEVKGR